MLYFLRQRDELEACDVYARRLVARGDVYDRAMSMLVRCLCSCDVYARAMSMPRRLVARGENIR